MEVVISEKDTVVTDPFIWYKDNFLPPVFCKQLITKFKNKRTIKHKGIVGGTDSSGEWKKSTDAYLNTDPYWKEECIELNEFNHLAFQKYTRYLKTLTPAPIPNWGRQFNMPIFELSSGNEIFDDGNLMMEIKPGDGYDWHADFHTTKRAGIRYLTWIYYLNTVEEGWTQFMNGTQIEPIQGRLVMFPATWQCIHRGYPPKQDKYISTGWISKSIENLT